MKYMHMHIKILSFNLVCVKRSLNLIFVLYLALGAVSVAL